MCGVCGRCLKYQTIIEHKNFTSLQMKRGCVLTEVIKSMADDWKICCVGQFMSW